MTVLPPEPDQESAVKRELLDLVRGPLLLASAVGLGFEAMAHLLQTLVIVLAVGGTAAITTLAMRGNKRYPHLYGCLFPKAQIRSGRRPRDDRAG